MGKVLNYLNRTELMFKSPQIPVAGLCDNVQAVCQDDPKMQTVVASTYLYQQVLYNNLFDGGFMPLPLFYSQSTHNLMALVFRVPLLQNTSSSFLTAVGPLL